MDSGGDSSAVADQLKDVHHIQATQRAFAAILGNGSVVTWGSLHEGGDSSAVQEQLMPGGKMLRQGTFHTLRCFALPFAQKLEKR